MIVTVEISLFPLEKNYSPVIRAFIDRLNEYDSIRTTVQPASTLVIGEFDEIMRIINLELNKIFSMGLTVTSQIKIINLDLSEQ
ncbi:MAG: thiamine-binding protein [Saprospiraceae bacterium]